MTRDYAALIKGLAAEHGIEDHRALRTAVWHAMCAMTDRQVRPETDDHQADTLDELAAAIDKVDRLLNEPTNVHRIMRGLFALPAPRRHALTVADLRETLAIYRAVAEAEHREREPRRGPLPKLDLRAATAVLVDFWTRNLGRDFAPDQNAWAAGRDVVLEPVTDCERFVYRALSYLAASAGEPGREGDLRSIANEFRRRVE